MAKSNDIETDFEFLELQFSSGGDWAVGESDSVHIKDLGLAFLGHWREFPLAGAGIRRFNNAPLDLEQAKREYRLQLQTDGYQVLELEIESDQRIRVNAERVINQTEI